MKEYAKTLKLQMTPKIMEAKMNEINELNNEQIKEWDKLTFYITGDQLVNLTRNTHDRKYILNQLKHIFDNQCIFNNPEEFIDFLSTIIEKRTEIELGLK